MPIFGRKRTIIMVGTALGLAVCTQAGSETKRLEGVTQLAQNQDEEDQRRKRRNDQNQGGGGQSGGQSGGQRQERSNQQERSGQDGGGQRNQIQRQQENQGSGQERRRQPQGNDGDNRNAGEEKRGRQRQDGESQRTQQGDDQQQQLRREKQNADQERSRKRDQGNDGEQQGQDRKQLGGDRQQQNDGDPRKIERERKQLGDDRQKQDQNGDRDPRKIERERKQLGDDRKQQDQGGDGDPRKIERERERKQLGDDRQKQDQNGDRDPRKIERKQLGGDGQQGPDGKRLDRHERSQGYRERVQQDRERFKRFEKREFSREERQELRRNRQEFTRENLKDVIRDRRRREENGRTIIEESDKRVIVREGGRAYIRHDETERLRGGGRDVRSERDRDGRNRTVITRPNGVQIINIEDDEGHLIRRIKRFPDGHEIVLIKNDFGPRRRDRDRRDRWRGPNIYIELPDVVYDGPEREYYAYADEAGEDEIYEILTAPPVEEFEEDYTLDEIRYSRSIRKRLRKLNLNTVNFEFGSWAVPEGQIDRLAVLARVINRVVSEDPEQIFMIAGHTDAVGSEEDNLSLSDRRAETVARILTDEFGVPAENLVTQGYGESDLLLQTDQAEARNRRVEAMRITPALAREGN
jgi:outer membrane protein OmpA-like peptidoglycan-associated protein